jgi:hypothetical protein
VEREGGGEVERNLRFSSKRYKNILFSNTSPPFPPFRNNKNKNLI